MGLQLSTSRAISYINDENMRLSQPPLRNLTWLRKVAGGVTYSTAFRPRYSSNVSAQMFEATKAEMLSRQPVKIWEAMSPTNSYLLSLSLADYLPPECDGPTFSRRDPVHPAAKQFRSPPQGITAGSGEVKTACCMPPGHELVYFPPQLSPSQLLPDGTDPSHSPPYPFERRMWASGSVQFGNGGIALNSEPAVCIETISDVSIKGIPGEEKVFVQLLREYMQPDEYLQWSSSRGEAAAALQEGEKPPSPVVSSLGTKEQRTLVFMRKKPPEEVKADTAKSLGQPARIIKPPHPDPDFSVTLTPNPTLLFHFSALSFNAHAIHLNPEYCRDVEGYHNLLVHGPLSLVLMLTVLRSQLDPDLGERLTGIDYRNLAPLYVGEEMEVCVKRKPARTREAEGVNERKWDVWVKGKDGGLRIKGTATSTTTTIGFK